MEQGELGASEAFLEVKERLSQAARVDRPVLIMGERGTGKELAAYRIHYLSKRWQGPYVTLNCAAIAPNLIDDELFGHEAGAFTGAVKRHPGRFELANGGTLFLDEISHLSLEAQAKLLRVVEYKGFQAVGGESERRADARLTAATNASLKKLCRQGRFLPDLYDRLSFEVIVLPPLRERKGDITLLAHYFGASMAAELKLNSPLVFSPEALAILEAHPFPGNVRELKNVVERAVFRASLVGENSSLGPEFIELDAEIYWPTEDLSPGGPKTTEFPINHLANPLALKEPKLPLGPGDFDELSRLFSLNLLNLALAQAHGNQRKAADLLSLSYHRFRSLRRKISLKPHPA